MDNVNLDTTIKDLSAIDKLSMKATIFADY
jgi:hypothetical protein